MIESKTSNTQNTPGRKPSAFASAGTATKSLLKKFGRKATPADGMPVATPAEDVPAAFRRSRDRRSNALSIAVMALVVPGLFATVAIPAYAIQTAEDTTAAEASQELVETNDEFAQTVQVDELAGATAVARDTFTATSAAEILRAELAASYASYTGPTYTDYLTNPAYPSFDLGSVAGVALQYQGVPYVFGGSDPSGFDCSGFVSFVYAQFGVGLPHSVSGIEASGTIIDASAALPGDIVTMSGHNGIYLGDGMMIDAPTDGDVVRVRPIYTSSYWIVRIGI